MITCAVCGCSFRVITNTHLRKHGLALQEYVNHYGSSLVSQETRTLLSSFKGDWDRVPLGQQPDALIARELGVERTTVGQARRRRGIPAFVGVLLTQEDNPCRSVFEAMYDAWLHWQGIEHEHEPQISGLPYIADFYARGKYIEIVGMLQFRKYSQKHARKRLAYEHANIPVTWLTPDDVEALYLGCPVALKIRSERICEDCGIRTYDLVKGVCRRCYMQRWHRTGPIISICLQCGKEFAQRPKKEQKYCSHTCYSRSLEHTWPSWEWLDEQIKFKSIRQVAFDLGVNPTGLYMRLRRRKLRNR